VENAGAYRMAYENRTGKSGSHHVAQLAITILILNSNASNCE